MDSVTGIIFFTIGHSLEDELLWSGGHMDCCQRRYKFSLSKYRFSVRIKIRDLTVNLVCTWNYFCTAIPFGWALCCGIGPNLNVWSLDHSSDWMVPVKLLLACTGIHSVKSNRHAINRADTLLRIRFFFVSLSIWSFKINTRKDYNTAAI